MAKDPMFTLDELKTELEALKRFGLKASLYYLKAEIRRRKQSAKNTGRPRLEETPRRKQLREAQERFKARKTKAQDIDDDQK